MQNAEWREASPKPFCILNSAFLIQILLNITDNDSEP